MWVHMYELQLASGAQAALRDPPSHCVLSPEGFADHKVQGDLTSWLGSHSLLTIGPDCPV